MKNRVRIIAHRGVNKDYPENSIAAIRAAVERKLDYVEVDVRTTVDGHLVLMHDKTVDRTTTGRGLVSALSVAQIRGLDAGVKKGASSAGEKVPLFSEALLHMSGKIGAYVDVKDADPQAVLAELEKHGMLEEAVIYSGSNEVLATMAALSPDARIMPEVDSMQDLRSATAMLHPKVVAMEWKGFSEDLVKRVRDSGAEVFLDLLGAGDTPEGVLRAIAAGVGGVQTDDPDMVLGAMRDSPV
jgi:glycerophosphoryl diester phosphodiesterase